MKKKYLLYLYYFISGFITLIFQILWQRKLLLIFGGTIYSIAILLSVWMLGLSIGNIIFNRVSHKIKRPIFLFIITQIIILIYALLLYPLFSLINIIDSLLFNYNNISLIVKGILTFLTLIIPTSLVGITLPLLSMVTPRKDISLLYSINTLGSVLGAFLTGFLFLSILGYNFTLLLTIFIGLLIYLSAFFILKNFDNVYSQLEENENFKIDITENSKKIFLIIFPILFFLSGFSSLSYEIVYNRILIYFTGNNTYCFTIITSIFIGGIFLGSFIYFKLRKNITSPIFIFAILELIIGLWNVILPEYSNIINEIIVNIKNNITLNFNLLIIIRILSSLLLIFVPASIFGFIFPLAIDIFININTSKKEKNISLLYFFNTVGSVLGPLLTGFLLISIFQIDFTLRIIALINIGIFIIISIIYILSNKFNFKYIFLTILFLLTLIITFNFDKKINVSRIAAKTLKSDEILYYKEGVFGTVTVSKRYNGILHLKINGVGEVPTDYNSIKVFRLLAYLPFTIKNDIKSLLTIAFGAGISYGSVCNIDSLEKKRNIEICKDVLEASKFFSEWNHNVLEKYKDTIKINDGRYFVEKTKEKFDLIISDSTHPIASDSWVLYTKEFYAHCKNRLTTDGIMVQWLPLHLVPLEDYKTILATFSAVFKECSLFITNEYSIIVGSSNPIIISPQAFNNLIQNEVIKKDLMSVNLSEFKDFYYSEIFNTAKIKEFCKGARIATDDFSPLQFAEARTINKDTRIEIFEKFIDFINNNEKDQIKKDILITILTSNIYYFKKQDIERLFFLDRKYKEFLEKNILIKEIEYQYNITKDAVSYYFCIPDNIQKFLLNPTEDNVKKIEKLCNIIKGDNNLEILRGILYYKTKRWDEALSVFINNHKRKKSPDSYKNIILMLKRMNRDKEAELYLNEAKKLYGEKWGDDIK
ncbi:MAG TPA: hypothetical protein PK351_10935 [Spirochaetota bacterium]|nr:hypothetical protein [Spirochaetota bacterium]HPP05322.1 hypothetical protein [Spirochaetota bacterium]